MYAGVFKVFVWMCYCVCVESKYLSFSKFAGAIKFKHKSSLQSTVLTANLQQL